MENRFLEMNSYLGQLPGSRTGKTGSNGSHNGSGANQFSGSSSPGTMPGPLSAWSGSFSVGDRALLVLIENGGIDLGIPEFVDKMINLLPGSSFISESIKRQIVDFIRSKLKSISADILENAELLLNRYSGAKPQYYSEVTILRAGSATLSDLQSNLIRLTREKKVTDIVILTHGGPDTIWVKGGISGNDIRGIKTANGGPVSIRSVYMMNCVGSSMNQAWLDIGARTSAGTIGNNYLPEPTTYFFFNNWKGGQTFENSVISAYRQTVALMNDGLRGFISALPFPGSSLVAGKIDLENFDFVKQSAPVVQGQRTLTIGSDELNFAQSLSSNLATTVVPVADLRRLAGSLDEDKIDVFVRTYYKEAKKTEKDTSLPAIGIMAQAALESGWGVHAPGYNFFGIKSSLKEAADKRQLITTTEKVQNDKLTPAQVGLDSIDKIDPVTENGKQYYVYTGKAWFRKYASAEESFTDHASLLKNNTRYKKVVAAANDLDKYFDEMEASGYAQATDYAKELKSIAKTIKDRIAKLKLDDADAAKAGSAAGGGSGSGAGSAAGAGSGSAKAQSRAMDNGTKHQFTLSDNGVELIKGFEGFFSKMYNDPVGHCTIGYGTLIHKGNCNGDSTENPYSGGVTKEGATKLLKNEASRYEQVLDDNVTVDLTQNQVDALISFVYNVGAANFKDSTMLKLLNNKKYADAQAEFPKWNKARQNGKLVELPGLTSRRKAEADLFGKK